MPKQSLEVSDPVNDQPVYNALYLAIARLQSRVAAKGSDHEPGTE